MKLVDNDSIIELAFPWNGFSSRVRFEYDNNGHSVSYSIYMIDATVAWISMRDNLGISIETAINVLGDPDSILILIYESYFPILFIEGKGVVFLYDAVVLPHDSQGELLPEIKILELDFFDPSYYSLFLERGIFTTGTLNEAETLALMHPWDGYGNIEKKYRP